MTTETTTAETTTKRIGQTRPLYQHIAHALQARRNCEQSGNQEWFDKWTEQIAELAKCLPSGAGIDSGTKIDRDRSTPDKIVLTAGYHHMNDGGYYDGWTEHTITVRASLLGDVELTIGGRDRNQIKEYLYDTYNYALMERYREEYDTATERSQYVRVQELDHELRILTPRAGLHARRPSAGRD